MFSSVSNWWLPIFFTTCQILWCKNDCAFFCEWNNPATTLQNSWRWWSFNCSALQMIFLLYILHTYYKNRKGIHDNLQVFSIPKKKGKQIQYLHKIIVKWMMEISACMIHWKLLIFVYHQSSKHSMEYETVKKKELPVHNYIYIYNICLCSSNYRGSLSNSLHSFIWQ